MNTGFLANPAPSNGYDAVLGALAPHAAPNEGSLGGTTPSVHNRVKQTFINPVATYPFIARKWAAGWELSFHAGDLMFVFNGEEKIKTKRHTTLANLPVLNTIMRMQDPKYTHFQKPDCWTFIGVMRNSSAASGLHPGQAPLRGGNALAPDRIINIDVRGATRMFNYWESARAGRHLLLAWRKMSIDGTPVPDRPDTDTVMPDVMGSEHKGTPNEELWERSAGSQPVYQLLPYDGDNASSGVTNMKVWHNEQSIKGVNFTHPICTGWVFQSLGGGELSDEYQAIRKATQLAQDRFRLPMVNAFLHV